MVSKVLVVVGLFVAVALGHSEHSHDLDEYFKVGLRITKEAGKLIAEKIWEVKNVQTKSSAVDFVTETDQQVENMIKTNISSHFPNHKFIGEESTAGGVKIELTDSPTWIIDPIDGTMNFVHGYPFVCISLALVVNKQTEVGIIYNPVLEQLFTARRGQGAVYNGKPALVSGKNELSQALLGAEYGTDRSSEFMTTAVENVKTLYSSAHGLRSIGSAALNMAHVAIGGLDAYFEFSIHAWDMAAGDLIVREAGGVVLDPAGGTFDLMSRRVLCASSKELADQISSKLKQFYPPRDM